MQEHIAIIGNGISGVTVARHIRKLSDKKITIISAETDYFFSRTALMYVYMGHMKFEHTQPYEDWFWEKNRIALKKGFVKTIDSTNKTLHFAEGDTLKYDRLVIATGSKPNKFGWPGQDLEGVMGMYHKQDLENLEVHAPNNKVCKRAVIVGGGLIGIELAEMLNSRQIPVTFLVREDSFWNGVLPTGESEMINRHIKNHHIDSAGVSPNIDFIKDSAIETGRGVKVNRYLETNIPDVYAIGDCAEQHEGIDQRRPIEAVWYTGRMMGETLAQTICGNRIQYKPGHWFNSAKFLDIEYQTYGWVFGEKGRPEYEKHFHWKHEDDTKCITVAYHKDTHLFLGINTFGIRMRHEVFDKWLTEKRDVDFVINHLPEANFDPEFYSHYEADILSTYNNQSQTVSS